ncbi:MAG TPA: MGMT family protein [bacterium]|nr:MGMT family protein [bacterium]
MSFKDQVLKTVKQIPRGRVMSYKKVAELSGSPRAWRSVGNILNKNKDSEVPCHRVIKSDGTIGGYRRGVKEKARRLHQEGVLVRKGKFVF